MGSNTLKVGINDLRTLFPDIAAEADGWDPTSVSAGSNQELSWRCAMGHQWIQMPNSRTYKGGKKCPFCSGNKILAGYNDLHTLYPIVASQAVGWDPSTTAPKSNKKVLWECQLGHKWQATVADRTPPASKGCPYCAGQKVLVNFNDLKTLLPEIAAEADSWDPASVSAGSSKKMSWRCQYGHTWITSVANRKNGTGCPVCSGRKTVKGFNDLKTLFPDVALDACGWDPTSISSYSHEKKRWQCKSGHEWEAVVKSRTSLNTGCPFCSGLKPVVGVNDLLTLHPKIAAEASGWDPGTVTAGSGQVKEWKCSMDHRWTTAVSNRTPPIGTGCPFCSGRRVLLGFNDLSTLYPEIAAEACGWDPCTVRPGSEKKRKWKCKEGHTWDAAIVSRTPPISSGCPHCAEYGFNPGKEAWFYLMQKPGEQQIGITNSPKTRMRTHRSNGWQLLEIAGPHPGTEVLRTENIAKRYLVDNKLLLTGFRENWATTSMEIKSLAELKGMIGIETDIF